MAQTGRLSYTGISPSTAYTGGADIVAQSASGNYSVVRLSVTCWNGPGGSTGSYSNNNGSQTMQIDGYGGAAQVTGKLPSGYAKNQLRWDVSADIAVAHASNGTFGSVTLRHSIGGWHSNVQTAGLGGFPRIPKRPSAPGRPIFSEIGPTSARATWTASADNAGSSIDGYVLRYWQNAEGTGAYTDVAYANNLSRVISGLAPSRAYKFVTVAHNNSSDQWSEYSTATILNTPNGRAGPPGAGYASEIHPTSLRLTWGASTYDGGYPLLEYLVVYSDPVSGARITSYEGGALSTLISGLTPGIKYTFEIYAINGSPILNYSPASTVGVTMPSGKPYPPGTPTFSEVLPTSVRVSWTPTPNDGDMAIDGYLLRYWLNAEGTGPYVDVSFENNLTRIATGLTPGLQYRFVVYTHNGSPSGYSNVSGAAVIRTLSGMWVKVSGVWQRAIPWVKVAGIWKQTSVFIKNSYVWKRGG